MSMTLGGDGPRFRQFLVQVDANTVTALPEGLMKLLRDAKGIGESVTHVITGYLKSHWEVTQDGQDKFVMGNTTWYARREFGRGGPHDAFRPAAAIVQENVQQVAMTSLFRTAVR